MGSLLRTVGCWLRGPTPDTDAATSEGILVLGSSLGALVNVGDHVAVSGRVTSSSRRRGDRQRLTTTEITTRG